MSAVGRSGELCGRYMGDNDATCPQLTCIRRRGHVPPCDNVNGDGDLSDDELASLEYHVLPVSQRSS